ncbi:MAG: type II toxin-antitoxin system VapC family toxin [Bacteroidales bacterium]|jgi:predicted nucleic acid-binding protein|nr:type II toxin-antitoxin system VapC family toxin [Bacteroidales bacterium]
MGTEYLLDSNVIIGFLDNKITPSGMKFVAKVVDKLSNISVISKIEVLRFKAASSTEKILEDFANYSVVYQLDEDVVEKTIEICRKHKIKLPDAIIAATCLVHRFVLLTRNVVDFKNIDNLNIVNPWEL